DAQPFTLAPQAEKKIQAMVQTARGAQWGISPINAIVSAKVGGEERVFLCSGEVVVAPRLRVDADPYDIFPMRVNKEQVFWVSVATGKTGAPGGPPSRLCHHKTGACKGVMRLSLPDGMECDPPQQSFDLPAESQTRLVFKLT